MKPKDAIFPFVIIPIGIAFVLISFMLFLYKGNNYKLLKAKLKLGAIILSFSWFATTQTACVTCYEEVESEFAYIDNHTFNKSDTVTGKIGVREHSFYSFTLSTLNEVSVQEGFLTPQDGKFDTYSEYFYFVLKSDISYGNYQLDIFGEKTEEINKEIQISSSQIEIVDETNN